MGVLSLERIIQHSFETLVEIEDVVRAADEIYARDTAMISERGRPKITMTETSCSTGVESWFGLEQGGGLSRCKRLPQ